VIENGMLATTFEGYGLGNVSFGNGLDDRWEFAAATERAYSYARSSYAPTGRKGFYSWHPDLTAAVNNVARTGSTATLTTAAAHNFEAGDTVEVAGLTATALNGTYTITGTPTDTTFTYTTSTTGNIEATADTGTATVYANGRLVSDFLSQGSTTTYNVPGNVDYNADNAVDFIIASTEDPTS